MTLSKNFKPAFMKMLFVICIFFVLVSCNQYPHGNNFPADSTMSPFDDTHIENKTIPKDTLFNYKVNSNITLGPLTLSFGNFSKEQKYIFDRYSLGYDRDEWRYLTAERGNKILTTNVSIVSSDKAPSLPCIFLYKYENNFLKYIGTFDYHFYRWEDYATYLGNYPDHNNDFAYTSKIRFAIGYEDADSLYSTSAIFVLVKNQATIVRSEEKFANPPVKYESSGCYDTNNYMINANTLKNFQIVAIINRQKLLP